jgi:hypothetical protein
MEPQGAREIRNVGGGGVSDSEVGRRLTNAGYIFAPSRAGKRFWVQPGTGRRLPEDHAYKWVRKEERRRLVEAGWERVEIEGSPETYWCRPDTGRLYPERPAVDALQQFEARKGVVGEGAS